MCTGLEVALIAGTLASAGSATAAAVAEPEAPPPIPQVEQPAPLQAEKDPAAGLLNSLRRTRRGASSAQPNLGKTLLTGSSGVSDDVFGAGGSSTLLGGG